MTAKNTSEAPASKEKKSRKKKSVTLSLQDLITQPRQLAHLPMMNKVTGYRVLIAVLQRLQGLWRIAKMPENARNGQLYMNFITDEFEVKRQKEAAYNEGDVVFKLRLSDIADDPHYDEARQALASLLHVHCFIPDPDNPGYYRTESLMQIKGRRENGKFVGTEFEVIIPRLTAENILDINLFGNYTRFVGYTAGRLRSSFSYPLYIYLSEEWRHHGEHFVIAIRDLRTRLGFVRDADDPERENRYAAWSQFCDKVLNQAQKELDKLAEGGGADFTFTYQGLLHGTPLPPYKRPDAVAFTILPTEAGRTIKEENDYAPNRAIAQKLMVEFFHLHVNQARALLRRVTPVIMPALLAQLQTWHDEFLAHQHPDVKNLAAWAHTSIDNFIREKEKKYFVQAEDVTAEDVTAEPTPEQAQQFAQAAINDPQPEPRYNAFDERLTVAAEEQKRLRAFTADLRRTEQNARLTADILDKLFIIRIHDGRRVVTFATTDGAHLSPERLNYYAPGFYARFIAFFNKHFEGWRLAFD